MPKNISNNSEKGYSISLLFAVIAVLIGIVFILIGLLLGGESAKFLSMLLTTLGVACIVSIAISVVEKHMNYLGLYAEQKKDVTEQISETMRKASDLLESCLRIGIKNLHPFGYESSERILCRHLKSTKSSIVVSGIGLTHLAPLFYNKEGELHSIMERKIREGVVITFILVKPDSEAVRQREAELQLPKKTNAAILSSLGYLEEVKKANNDNVHIKLLENMVPKATIVRFDDNVILYSPYYGSKRMPASWIIETEKNDPFYLHISKDIEHIDACSIE